MTAADTMLVLPPEMLAHRYDPQHDAIHLIRADREARRSAAFLTDEHLPGATAPLVARRQEALALAGETARINFVFHSAYCCSTLIANAYDRPGKAFSLKEPVLLNDLVGWRHRGAVPAKIGEVMADGLRLLARPFAPGEACIIKPSNVVNGLAPAMIAARPEAGILLLYAPLEAYLRSIANKRMWGRQWVRELLLKQLTEGLVELGFERTDYFLHTDLQVAAVGWLAQHALFGRIARTWPDRVRTLNSEVLLARPAEALAALDQLFGVPGDAAERTDIVATTFTRHAKFGTQYSAADRDAEQASAARLHAEEIGNVSTWAVAVAANARVTMELPNPLLG